MWKAKWALVGAVLVACGCSSEATPSSESDAGSTVDAGQTVDAGHADAGHQVDAGPVDAGPPVPIEPTFTNVFQILKSNCIDCHYSSDESFDVADSADIAYSQLVNHAATRGQCAFQLHTRVIPGDPDHSLLYMKLIGTQDCGFTMPSTGDSTAEYPPLSEQQLKAIHDWIANGAAND